MKFHFKDHRLFFILMLTYVFALLIVQPWGNFPLNDDWSYAKSVLSVDRVGHVDIGEWPAMTLLTHALWGYVFIKLFGFSFLVLRISTWISMCIGLYVFYLLGLRLSGSKPKAVLMTAVLLYNPIYFNLSNTFMTDVNFITLLILCLYVVYSFLNHPSFYKVMVILFLSVAITLLRQFGVLVPVAFLMITCFIKENKLKWMCSAFAVLCLTYFTLLYYENFLKSFLTPWSAYKFSNGIKPFELEFWKRYWYFATLRYKEVFIHMFFHTFIFAAAFFPAVLRRNNWWTNLCVTLLSFALVWYVYSGCPLQMNNVFLHTAVGTDTSHETLSGTYLHHPHFYNAGVEQMFDILKYIFISCGFATAILHLMAQRHQRVDVNTKLFFLFTCLFLIIYISLLFIADSYFDRYFLPLIVIALLAYARFSKYYELNWWTVTPILVAWMYVAVGGTHDYFAINTTRWQFVSELREKEHIPSEKIHGSFEQVCWNEGNQVEIWTFASLRTFNYVIQFHREDSFMLEREKVFQRFWPPGKDTLRLYKRNLFAKPAAASDSP